LASLGPSTHEIRAVDRPWTGPGFQFHQRQRRRPAMRWYSIIPASGWMDPIWAIGAHCVRTDTPSPTYEARRDWHHVGGALCLGVRCDPSAPKCGAPKRLSLDFCCRLVADRSFLQRFERSPSNNGNTAIGCSVAVRSACVDVVAPLRRRPNSLNSSGEGRRQDRLRRCWLGTLLSWQ
jgi:hypothetical protein